jgi:hypothetical protein
MRLGLYILVQQVRSEELEAQLPLPVQMIELHGVDRLLGGQVEIEGEVKRE